MSALSGQRIDEVIVVVPANDEEHLIAECLSSVAAAITQLGAVDGAPAVRVVVALDDCTDGTAAIVARYPGVETVELAAQSVGMARATGVELGLGLVGAPPENVWIANTDADTHVPTNWLVRHVALARDGADAVVGAIRPDPRDLSEEQYRAWEIRARAAAHEPSVRIHGANLGVRADAYRSAGGFSDLRTSEDVDLVGRLRADGARLVFSDASWVVTSARTVGRAPGGYADYVLVNY